MTKCKFSASNRFCQLLGNVQTGNFWQSNLWFFLKCWSQSLSPSGIRRIFQYLKAPKFWAQIQALSILQEVFCPSFEYFAKFSASKLFCWFQQFSNVAFLPILFGIDFSKYSNVSLLTLPLSQSKLPTFNFTFNILTFFYVTQASMLQKIYLPTSLTLRKASQKFQKLFCQTRQFRFFMLALKPFRHPKIFRSQGTKISSAIRRWNFRPLGPPVSVPLPKS